MTWWVGWLTTILSIIVAGTATAQEPVTLYEPAVYPVVYEGLTRWCGGDTLIVNGLEGQRLLHFDQAGRQEVLLGDTVDPVVLETEVGSAEDIGCILYQDVYLTYWKVADWYWETASWLVLQRLRRDVGNKQAAGAFKREEIISLPSGFLTWARYENYLYLAYYRPCAKPDAGSNAEAATDAPNCAGIERINLATLDRDLILERQGTELSAQGDHYPDIALVGDAKQPSAVVIDDQGTSYCRINETTLGVTCRPALKEGIKRVYYDHPRQLSRDAGANEFISVGGRLLLCHSWDDPEWPAGTPLCREITLHADSDPVEELQLMAVLPDERAIVQADYCLSLGRVSPDTGVVTDLVCLLDPIRAAVPQSLRSDLVAEEPFEEEVDGVTIPAWDISVSSSGKWLAIQVPRRDCGNDIPKPETAIVRSAIGSCGQLMVWQTDHFIR